MTKTPNPRRRRRPLVSWGCLALLVLPFALGLGLYLLILSSAAQTFGPPSDKLGASQQFQYAALLLWYDGQATRPVNSAATAEVPFTIAAGEGAAEVATRLEAQGILRDAAAFTAYLVYSGLDTGLQAGEFELSPALPPPQIAQKLQDATPTRIKFIVLPGWRLEEVAALLPTSGFEITPDEFLQAARQPASRFDFLPAGASAEGFLLPGEYSLPRGLNAVQLVDNLVNNASLALSREIRAGFEAHGLNVYQGVTLASIIQREAVRPEEQAAMASVFFNRLAAGMPLQTDPTVQYALGFDAATNSWWKAPLAVADLEIQSPYNTYQNLGLPPGPISSPGLSAIQAVAYPAQTPYYYFRARCDGSGLHDFSETFDQHLQSGCP
jgi:UPF0755 protein